MSQESDPSRAEVFICYKSEDRKRVEDVCKVLKARGISLWLDVEGIGGGQYWPEKASRAIHNCNVFLLMCSALSLTSHHVRNEMVLSQDLKKPLIPVHLEENLRYPSGWDLVLPALQAIKILDRPANEWLPPLLKALKEHRVGMRIPQRPPDGLMSATVAWLEKLRATDDELPGAVLQADDLQGDGTFFSQKATDAVIYLKGIDNELPQLYQTLIACARGESVAPEEAAALRQLQGALVDVARVVMFVRLKTPERLALLPFPPYDLWLPFKDGRCTPAPQSSVE